MQHRMKTHRMSESEIEALFGEAQMGRLATLNPDVGKAFFKTRNDGLRR